MIRVLLVSAMCLGLPAAAAAQAPAPPRFDTSTSCQACHNGLTAPDGEDVSIGVAWRATMMANAARDPYWQAAVRREALDHPTHEAEIQHECAACHMPMARYDAKAAGRLGQVFAHLMPSHGPLPDTPLAMDGVSCTVCHRMTDENFGERASANGGFVVAPPAADGTPSIFGPFAVTKGHASLMRSATGFEPREGKHVQASEMCATCHTLFTKSLGPDGEITGELPEQVPYLEWRESRYRTEQSCQDCHMPVVSGPTAIASVLGEPREGLSRHSFQGANFFIPRMLNMHRDELGVQALPQELEAQSARALAHLQDKAAVVAVRATREGARIVADVSVENLAGHKLPTAYPSRRAWLHVVVRDATDVVVWESGRPLPDGSIEGNDNDRDAARFEPHYAEVTAPDQVQIYEPILGDPAGRVTTGLLTAVRYLKDNRILPHGFDKAVVPGEVAVHGEARTDADFLGGGDRTRYVMDVGSAPGPLTVEAALYYQPIGYRWAHNLRARQAYEIERFVSSYEKLAAASAARVASASTTVR